MSTKKSGLYEVGLMRQDYEEQMQRRQSEAIFGYLDTEDLCQSLQVDVTYGNIPSDLKREDYNDFAQNNSSTGITNTTKVLSNNMGKEARKYIRIHFESFLKEKAKLYSQIFLVFAYLFFLKNKVPPLIFSAFKTEMLKYYDKKMAQEMEENKRKALMKKISPNIDLLDYLFPFNGEQVNFQVIRILSQPLFQNRQAKQLNGQLDSAIQVYEQIVKQL